MLPICLLFSLLSKISINFLSTIFRAENSTNLSETLKSFQIDSLLDPH